MDETFPNGSTTSPNPAPKSAGKGLSPLERANLIENVKQLALLHGIPQAAEISGVNRNTIKTWACRYNWRIPHAAAGNRFTPKSNLATIQPAELLRTTLHSNKSRSTLALSSYLARTSELIDQRPDAAKINLSRRAKDLGDLHGRLFPPETSPNNILNIAILTGQRKIRRLSDESETC
jgi:hypothetical protein